MVNIEHVQGGHNISKSSSYSRWKVYICTTDWLWIPPRWDRAILMWSWQWGWLLTEETYDSQWLWKCD